MFGFLFKKKNTPKQFIQQLEEEHQTLLKIYTNVIEFSKQRNFEKINENLNLFLEALQAHLQKEDDIYNFLETNLNKKAIMEYIENIKQDMNSIKKKISILLKKYKTLNESNVDDFIKDFEYLGSVILKRIEVEENILYKFYILKKE